MNKKLAGSTLAVLSGLCYAFLGFFGKKLFAAGLSVFCLQVWRYVLAAAFAMLVVTWRGWSRFSVKPSLVALAIGLFLHGFSGLTFFAAMSRMPTSLVMVIFFVFPAIVLLLNSLFFRAIIHRKYKFAMLLMLLGMVLLVGLDGRAALDLQGVLFALASAFFYACYVVASKRNVLRADQNLLMILLGSAITAFFVSSL